MFVNGLRVTDDETREIAEMVFGRVNKRLVTMVEELGVKAIGISGKDGGLLKVDKKYADGQDIGFVGDINEVDSDILYNLGFLSVLYFARFFQLLALYLCQF